MSRSRVTVERAHSAVIGRLLLGVIVALTAALLVAYDPEISRGGSADAPAVIGRDAAVGAGAPLTGSAAATPATGTRHAEPIEPTTTRALPSPRVVVALGHWRRARATWYGPGFYGNTTACGQRYTTRIRGVAVPSGGRYHLRCGHRLTICYRSPRRCVLVRVIDTGAFRSHRFDLSARTAMDLCRCTRPYTMRVRWQHGWRRA